MYIMNTFFFRLGKALKGPFALKKLVLHRCDIYLEEECIENLRALCEKEGFTLYIDGPIQKILQVLQYFQVLYSDFSLRYVCFMVSL